MRILFTISLLLFFFHGSCQQKMLGLIRPNTSTLIVGAGESNEPGEALNSSATAAELVVRTCRIWDINTELFQYLDVGTNNLGTFSTSHGIELQMANLYDSTWFGKDNFFIVKTGQGSTRVSQWMPGTTLYQRMTYRIDKALTQILREHGVAPARFWMGFTLAINDIFAGYPAASFKTDVKVIFDSLHVRYPSLKIGITNFNQPAYGTYNTVIGEIVSELSYVELIDTASAELNGDNTHWSYLGYKLIGRRFKDLIIQ